MAKDGCSIGALKNEVVGTLAYKENQLMKEKCQLSFKKWILNFLKTKKKTILTMNALKSNMQEPQFQD